MFDFFKKDMPERESSASKEAPETATQADDLDALFDAAEANGDAEAPDLEALRHALSAKAKDETPEAPSAPEPNEASNGQADMPAAPPAFEEDDAPPELDAPDPPENGDEASPEEVSPNGHGENGHAPTQHTERLSWIVDFVSTDKASTGRAEEARDAEDSSSKAAQAKTSHPSEASDAPPVGTEEVEKQTSTAEASEEENVDLEAFQQAIRAQQDASDPATDEGAVTEDEFEALFGEDEGRKEGEDADREATQHAQNTEDAAEEAAPEGWKAESAYTSEEAPPPRTDGGMQQPPSSPEEVETGEEEPPEEAFTEGEIAALYGERGASEGDAPDGGAHRDSEAASPEADRPALEENSPSGEAGAIVSEVDDPVLGSGEPDLVADGTASGDVAQPDSHDIPGEDSTASGARFEESGVKAPEDGRDTSGGMQPDRKGLGSAGHDRNRAPVLEDDPGSTEPGVQEPVARHEGSIATEDVPSSPETSTPASAPENESDVAVRPKAASDPVDTAAGEDHSGEDIDPDVLVGNLHTDVIPGEDITFKEKIASVQEEVMHGDGHLEEVNEPSADGHTLDMGGNTPVANISNWMQGAQYAPDSQEEVEESSEEVVSDFDTSDRVVSFLLRSGVVTPEQVQEAQKRRNRTEEAPALWRALSEIESVDREAVFAGAARVYAFPFADLERHGPNPDFTKSVMKGFSEEKHEQLLTLGVVPYRAVREKRREALKLLFITHDPARPEVNRLLERISVEYYEVLYAPESEINAIIGKAFPKKNEYLERVEKEGGAVDLGTNYQEDDELIDEDKLEAEISRSKLINLFEATLVEAVRQGASDIHIYPNAQKKVEIHFRIDGRLNHWHTEDKVHPEALLAVIKDNSMNVDRFERDAAQDGFIQRRVDEALIRFRVSVMPIANASQEVRSESIVIRVLDDRKVIKDLSKLGLLEGALEKFEHAISQPHGMVIMTGPTGSGKSTTLVAALHRVVSPEVNVLTIEDPVEYIIEDVRQIKLSHKLKLEDALRSLLRHDPDVVMVGEMRDRSTAELAIKLANTGHLTFSTLHTNDAPSAVARLYKMGIEPFLIAYAINLVVAQRLIRKLCPECKRLDGDPDPVMLQKLGFSDEEIANTDFYLPGEDEHCPVCNGFGFKGRRAISEAMYFSREIRHMIVEADRMIDEDAIREQAQKEGMLTLRDSAREVVKMGETSVREMIRVVTSEAY